MKLLSQSETISGIIWQNLKNINRWLTDSPTWIQEMLAHLKIGTVPRTDLEFNFHLHCLQLVQLINLLCSTAQAFKSLPHLASSSCLFDVAVCQANWICVCICVSDNFFLYLYLCLYFSLFPSLPFNIVDRAVWRAFWSKATLYSDLGLCWCGEALCLSRL